MASYIEVVALTLAKGLGTNTILLKDIGREGGAMRRRREKNGNVLVF